MATQKKATPPKKAAAAKPPVKKAEDANETTAPAAKEETTTSVPAAPEQPSQEATNTGEDKAASAPPYDLTPEEQTPEQKAYVFEHNRYLDLHGVLPLNTLDTDALKAANDQKQHELDNPVTTAPAAPKAPEAKPAKATGKAKARPANKVSIVNQKTGEKKTVNKMTWDILKKSPQGWKEAPEVPAEVRALKGGK